MAGIIEARVQQMGLGRHKSATSDPRWVQVIIITLGVAFLTLFLVLPTFVVFQEAFRKGFGVYQQAFADDITRHAIFLTLTISAIVVPLNTIFGLAAAWCVSRFDFRGKRLLVSLIELPLWVSPVIGGLIYVLLFGAQGIFGPWLQAYNIQIIFALPGLVLATLFVTFPFVARTIIPQMEAQGYAEEEAALTLGANGWRTFFLITIPKIKWSLLYGIILCNARSMGEFGAVSVVSGHISRRTNTIPLQIEILYNDYQFAAAFALASLLCLLALVTLVMKSWNEWHTEQQLLLAQEAFHQEPAK